MIIDFEVIVTAQVCETRSAFLQLLVTASHRKTVDVHRYGHDDFSRTAAVRTSRSAARRVPAEAVLLPVVTARGHVRQLTGLHAFPFRPTVLKPYFHLPKKYTNHGRAHGGSPM